MCSGALIASGQINHMGFRAYVIVWDWNSQCELLRHELHKVKKDSQPAQFMHEMY